MNAAPPEPDRLADRIGRAGADGRWLWDGLREVALRSCLEQTRLGGRLGALDGASVLIRTPDQLSAAIALIELDGVASRLVLCPPDLRPEDLPEVVKDAKVDAIVGAGQDLEGLGPELAPLVAPRPAVAPQRRAADTEWVMFTSGTSGRPKMVAHTLSGLTGAIPLADPSDPPTWGTFYDIRRYGGMQMFLRACLGGGSMILSRRGEEVSPFLERLASRGVTHLSATPSHWRAALMSPALRSVRPRYVRLSGEIADQALLDQLKAAFPGVPIGWAFASTEAGVGFEVDDGRAGFPAALVGAEGRPVQIRVQHGSLRLRSGRAAKGYVGGSEPPLADADGFVDTGDMVELRGDRYHFVGRRGGVINVGGLKVHPEEVEAAINLHPGVRMSRVTGRRSPITGAIVVADVVAAEAAPGEALAAEILAACRAKLPPFKTPASIRFVPSLQVTSGGKLERRFG